MTKIAFGYVSGTKFETLSGNTTTTDYFNLKNKAEGARRYGFRYKVVKATNPSGEVAFRFELQATLNESNYQSRKYGDWVATEDDANAALSKTLTASLKRYGKLAQDPKSKIEYRPSNP